MDVNTMYAAVDIGAQDEYDTQIVKDVWNNDTSNFQNFTEKDFAGETNMCEATYEAQGGNSYAMCRSAALSCGTDVACNVIAEKYAKALEGGYSKDFEAFKKKTSMLASIGDIATNLLGGLISKLGGGSSDQDVEVGGGRVVIEQEKSKTGLYIGIGVVAVAAIGTAIYFARKK